MNIAVIGGGYVGLVTGACFASLGHHITILEIDPCKIDLINSCHSPFYEKGLETLLLKHIGVNLAASNSYDSVSTSDIIIIAVGTPPNPDGTANLSYIKSAAEQIATAFSKGNMKYPVIVVKSTVPPGTTQDIVYKTIKNTCPDLAFGCCMNPEFLREGRAIEDFMHPDRIVIGSSDPKTIEVMKILYKDIDAPIIVTSNTAAEMIKYTSNAFLATKISFVNEIGNLCKKLGIDVYEVMQGVGLDKRISPHFLNAGAGFGGSCFPKDVSALAAIAEQNGIEPKLLNAVLEVNDQQPFKMIELLQKRIENLSGKHIAILGLAFKDNTDDIRESRAIPVIERLLELEAVPVLYDPMAMDNMKQIFPDLMYAENAASALKDADGCLVMTEWPEFSKLDSEFDGMKQKVIIDGRHILQIKDSEGVCW